MGIPAADSAKQAWTAPAIRMADLKDPTLYRLNNLFTFLYSKLGDMYQPGKRVDLRSNLTVSGASATGQSQIPSDDTTLITLATAKSLLSGKASGTQSSGFPASGPYTPTIASGAVTATADTTAAYQRSGQLVFYRLKSTVTITGATDNITVTLPVAPAATGGDQSIQTMTAFIAGVNTTSAFAASGSILKVICVGGNFAAATPLALTVTGWYEAQ